MPVHTAWTKSLQESHTVLVLVQRRVVMETLHLNSPSRQYKSPERCIGVKKQQAFSIPFFFVSVSLSSSLSSFSLCLSLLEMDKSKYLQIISSVFVWDLCKWLEADYFGSAGLILRLCGESWRNVRWYAPWNRVTCMIERQREREREKTRLSQQKQPFLFAVRIAYQQYISKPEKQMHLLEEDQGRCVKGRNRSGLAQQRESEQCLLMNSEL